MLTDFWQLRGTYIAIKAWSTPSGRSKYTSACGCGVDDSSEALWQLHLAEHKLARAYRNKPFKWYDLIDQILNKSASAKGMHTFAAHNEPPPSQTLSSQLSQDSVEETDLGLQGGVSEVCHSAAYCTCADITCRPLILCSLVKLTTMMMMTLSSAHHSLRYVSAWIYKKC